MEITSTTNPLIKSLVRLHDRKERTEQNRCIIEGKRAVSTAVLSMNIQHLFCTEEQRSYAHALTPEKNIIVVPDFVMKKISTTKTPSGLLGVFEIPKAPDPDQLGPGIVLARIQDPGNMGTLIRTAVACQVSSVVIVEGCDPWSPKALQAAAGMTAHIPLFRWSWDQLIRDKKHFKLAALVVRSGSTPHSLEAEKSLLVVGNEAQGIPQEWLTTCNIQITLPMPGDAESLNAAVAGSIALYLTFVYKG